MNRRWTDDDFRPGKDNVSAKDKKMLTWAAVLIVAFLAAVFVTAGTDNKVSVTVNKEVPVQEVPDNYKVVYVDTGYCEHVEAEDVHAEGQALICHISPSAEIK